MGMQVELSSSSELGTVMSARSNKSGASDEGGTVLTETLVWAAGYAASQVFF